MTKHTLYPGALSGNIPVTNAKRQLLKVVHKAMGGGGEGATNIAIEIHRTEGTLHL